MYDPFSLKTKFSVYMQKKNYPHNFLENHPLFFCFCLIVTRDNFWLISPYEKFTATDCRIRLFTLRSSPKLRCVDIGLSNLFIVLTHERPMAFLVLNSSPRSYRMRQTRHNGVTCLFANRAIISAKTRISVKIIQSLTLFRRALWRMCASRSCVAECKYLTR